MTPLQRFLSSPAVRAAHARHKDDVTKLPCLMNFHTPIETTMPDADAREQIARLNRAGVFCLEVVKTSAGTRVVYAVPDGSRFG